MRLTHDQIQIIKSAAHHVLGDDARVILFGSRVNDQLRGGDLDLMFETPHGLENRQTAQDQLYVALVRGLGDRKIDMLLKDARTPEVPVMRMARETGIQL